MKPNRKRGNGKGQFPNLATAYAAVGRIGEARRELQAAIAAPDYNPARVALQQIGAN